MRENGWKTKISVSWTEWTQQLQAYVAWVNSQLKKKPGCLLITDLRRDLQDGVILAYLIEVLSNEQLVGIDYNPVSGHAAKENIERILQFMASKRIHMPYITVKDIVEGSLKPIMRLILALAAHYKPGSVRHCTAHAHCSRRDSGTSVAALVDSQASQPRRSQASTPTELRYCPSSSSDRSYSDSDRSSLRDHLLRSPHPLIVRDRLIDGRGEVDGKSTSSSPSVQHSPSPSLSLPYNSRPSSLSLVKNKSTDLGLGHSMDNSSLNGGPHSWQDAEDLPTLMLDDVQNVKQMLLHLHRLLLNEQSIDGRKESSKLIEDSWILVERMQQLKSRLQSAGQVSNELRQELRKTNPDMSIQTRLNLQETTLVKMKSELLRLTLAQRNQEAEKILLQKKLDEKTKQFYQLRKEFVLQEQLLEDQKREIENVLVGVKEAKHVKAVLQAEWQDKQNQIQALKIQNKELLICLRTMQYGDQLGINNAALASLKTIQKNILTSPPEELQMVRDSIQSLRQYFKSQEPQQHTLDTIEQSAVSLSNKLCISLASRTASDPNKLKRLNFDSTGDPKRSPITSLPGFSVQRLDTALTNGKQFCTKVLYFTERTVTPFMSSIPKRLGEITLRDFKAIFDRAGNYHFHFKAHDPEFGTVKEEVFLDDAVLPGWEGKIIAWIQEDHG